MPLFCIPSARWGTRADAPARSARGYYLGRVLVAAASRMPGGRLGTELCGFSNPFNTVNAEWPPGTSGRVVLTVSNSNSILDDSWDFKIDGVTVSNYDGGGATSISFSADLPPGSYTLSAECVGEQSDNYFEVTLSVDGVTIIAAPISGYGEVGETVTLGSFIVPFIP